MGRRRGRTTDGRRRQRTRSTRWVAAALLVALGVTACGGEDMSSPTPDMGEPAPPAFGGGDDRADEDTSSDGDQAIGEDPILDVGGDTAGRDVIRRANVTLASDDPEATVTAIGRAATNVGGFVAGTALYREGGILQGTITLRVPSERLSEALGQIEAAGAEVRARELGSEDVTDQLTDIAAQLRNLRALEIELLELLTEARETNDTEKVLLVFDRVRATRSEIERLDARQAALRDLVSLATIQVTVEPTQALLAATASERDPEPRPWSPARQVEVAWQSTVRAMQSIADLAIVAVVTILPVTLVLALPIALLVWLAMRARRRRPAPPPPTSTAAPAGSAPPPPTTAALTSDDPTANQPAQPAEGGPVPSENEPDRD
jgi:hypothetical protein